MASPPNTSLADRIRQIIKEEGLNYSKLAKIAGVTPTAINDVANGVINNPKISMIINIASNLGINPSWLLMGEGQMKRETTGTDDMSDFFSRVIQEKDQTIFEMRKAIYEKDKLIAQYKGRVGKSRGVSVQAAFLPLFG